MSLEAAIQYFDHLPVRGFRFDAFHENGRKRWKASCQFDVVLILDPTKVLPVELGTIEYRQYIRGGAWVRRNDQKWPDDDKPNGNATFLIPPYAGQAKVPALPTSAVPEAGLSLSWKEDGKSRTGDPLRYGYRDSPPFNEANEKDYWTPQHTVGTSYKLRDTPSLTGDWLATDNSIDVWIELWFRGAVVQVEPGPDGKTRPVKLLREIKWTCFWQDHRMSEWYKYTAEGRKGGG